jgi:hypothetical protein
VLLALPNSDVIDEYSRRAKVSALPAIEGQQGKPRLDVVHVFVDPFTEEENAALDQLRDV